MNLLTEFSNIGLVQSMLKSIEDPVRSRVFEAPLAEPGKM
jgi:hypothetical protein